MKKYLALFALALCASLAQAQSNACQTPYGQATTEVTTSVSTSSATTLVTNPGGGQIIHICSIALALPESNTLQFQGSDSTVLDGPYKNLGSYVVQWGGQLTTRRAAANSHFQIKLTNAPSSAVGVTVIYYIAAN